MALQTNGYVKIGAGNFDTYDHWRAYCLSHGINVDYYAGNQCFDSPALLWWQYNLYLVTNPAGNGSAYQCWTISRNMNARTPFVAVEGKTNIKRGDCLVFNRGGWSKHGHICFADQDYNQRPHSNTIMVLGQNQGQGVSSGTPSNVVEHSLDRFLGIFRNTKWSTAPTPTPTPSVVYNKGKYNFVLFNRRKRQGNG